MKIMKAIKRAVNMIIENMACVLLVFMVLFVAADVFCRYVLNFSFRWSEEVSLILLIWFCFITMAIGVRDKLHLTVNMFVKNSPEFFRNGINKVSDLLTLVFSVLLTIFGSSLVKSSMRSTLPATGLPTGVLYIMIPIAGIVIIFNMVCDRMGIDS